MFEYNDNSTLLGSIKTIFKSSGVLLKISDIRITLRHTLFPEPVAPATKRCGILVTSKIISELFISNPNTTGRFPEWFLKFWEDITLFTGIIGLFITGTSKLIAIFFADWDIVRLFVFSSNFKSSFKFLISLNLVFFSNFIS